MPTCIATQSRRWPRRLFISAGILLLIPVAVLILAIAINRFDEPLESSTQAWLNHTAASAPQARNGYLALLALDAQVANPTAAAGEVVRMQHAIFAEARISPQPTEPRYREARTRLLPPIEGRIRLNDCLDDCYDYVLAHADKMKKISLERADLLQRYSAMLDFTDYAEDIPHDPESLYPNHGLARKLSLLYLGNVVFTLQQGDAQTAYRQWARHQRFWQMAAAGSVSLRDTMAAIAQLERSQALLPRLLAAHPGSAASARLHALPLLAQQPRLAPLVANSMVAEFQMQAYVATSLIYHFSPFAIGDMQPAKLADRLGLLFYQPNASLNLLYRLHQYDLHRNAAAPDGKLDPANANAHIKAPCADNIDWHMLANPVGKMLLCREDAYDLRRYHQRAAKADSIAAELALKLRAIS